jgi:hypothetical protein
MAVVTFMFRVRHPNPDSLTLLHPNSILIQWTRLAIKQNRPDCSERKEEELHPENVPPVGFGISASDVHFIRHNAPASRKQPLKGLGREKDWISVDISVADLGCLS